MGWQLQIRLIVALLAHDQAFDQVRSAARSSHRDVVVHASTDEYQNSEPIDATDVVCWLYKTHPSMEVSQDTPPRGHTPLMIYYSFSFSFSFCHARRRALRNSPRSLGLVGGGALFFFLSDVLSLFVGLALGVGGARSEAPGAGRLGASFGGGGGAFTGSGNGAAAFLTATAERAGAVGVGVERTLIEFHPSSTVGSSSSRSMTASAFTEAAWGSATVSRGSCRIESQRTGNRVKDLRVDG